MPLVFIFFFRRIKITGPIDTSHTSHGDQSDTAETDEPAVPPEVSSGANPILVVSVENLIVSPLKSDTETKALSAEIIKTIRDIMSLNQLYKESLSHLLDSGKKDINAPAALADFAAALSSSDPPLIQEVTSGTCHLECDISMSSYRC